MFRRAAPWSICTPTTCLTALRLSRTIGYAYYLQGDRAAAGRAYAEALALAQASGNIINTILATTGLGQIQQLENQLYPGGCDLPAVLQLIGDYSPSNAGVVNFGLARICYEWNDLECR